MLITKLQIVGLRSIEQAEFTFQAGLNLLVGVNGVGKTTVLDALRVCLSRILPEITASRSQRSEFDDSDIRTGADTLQLSCDFNLKNTAFNLLLVKQRENNIPIDIGNVREQTVKSPDIDGRIEPPLSVLSINPKTAEEQPLGLYLSTRRALIVDQAPSKSSAVGGQAAAFADSLSPNRELNLRLLAQWFRAQEELGKEKPASLKHVETLRNAVSAFMPSFQNLAIIEENGTTRFIIEKNGNKLSLNQLSDGERGVLAIVLDLARRLLQANPDLEDPVKDGIAVVLIDELDLHLHPKWQRNVVDNLTRTFQNCQFIVTTHSPQIIGEVKPERITIISDRIYNPSSSFGMDSSQILEEIMDTKPRNAEVDNLLLTLSQKIDEDDLSGAKKLLAKLKIVLGPNDPEVTRSETMIVFLESEVDE